MKIFKKKKNDSNKNLEVLSDKQKSQDNRQTNE